jgi:hypothetical protein
VAVWSPSPSFLEKLGGVCWSGVLELWWLLGHAPPSYLDFFSPFGVGINSNFINPK